MIVVYSKSGVPVRLTDERWNHIIRRHPEMESFQEQVLQTVSDPDMIQKGDFGELLAAKFFPHTPLTGKYLVVAYREIALMDGFILTSYLSNKPSPRRVILWKR